MVLIRSGNSKDTVPPDRPVFIIGPHRSGTTLLYRILSKHPDLGYFNQADRRLRDLPRLARLVTQIKRQDSPAEAQKIWDRFRTGDDDIMGVAEATPEVIRWYREKVGTVLDLRQANRFVAKYPRLSLRLSWINAIFPDAVFIHMLRDWRAVVSSTVIRRQNRRDKNGGWFGVRIPGWQNMGELPHEVVVGRIFRFVTQTLEAEGSKYGDRFIRTSYEGLCDRPLEVTRNVLNRCGLDWTPAFEQTIPTDLRNANYKWREHLDEKMVARIKDEDPAFFARHERN